MEIVLICPSYLYTHRLAHLSTLIKESFFCRTEWLIQRPTSGQCAEDKNVECLVLNGTAVSELLLSRLKDYQGKKGNKDFKSQGEWVCSETAFTRHEWQDHCTHQLTEAVTAYRRPAQYQVKHDPSTGMEGAREILLQAEALLAIDDCSVGQVSFL